MNLDGQEESENVEDRRGSGGGRKAGVAVGGGVGLLVLIVAMFLKVDPAQLTSLISGGGQGPTTSQQQRPIDPAEEELRHFTAVILGDTEKVWTEEFQKFGKVYPKPKLVLFSGQVESACGMAESATGPFYCGGDQRVYIDLSFYKEMQQQLHSSGEFARAYVVAHEVGHHVQRLLGFADAVDDARRTHSNENQMSVRLELQADYLAGVWAAKAEKKFNFLGNGDLESAINCAQNIGDDTLQKNATGTVRPEKFTHGSSAQRVRWFRKGFDSGDVAGAKALFDARYEQL